MLTNLLVEGGEHAGDFGIGSKRHCGDAHEMIKWEESEVRRVNSFSCLVCALSAI